MANVDSKTSLKIDELIESTVISGYINGLGQLVLVTRGGAEIPAGSIALPFGERWSPTIDYGIGDVVGYAGRLWKALSSNTNKPPALFTSKWTSLTGESLDDWSEKDPFFDADDVNDPWNFSLKTGTSTPSLTNTAGQFETGIQALKLTMNASSFQRIYTNEENIVRGGEVVTVQVRAKLLSAAADVELRAALLQNDSAGAPVSGETGVATTAATEGVKTLTTSWATYTFTMVSVNAKPRANANVTVTTNGASAVVLIDYIRIKRGQDAFLSSHPVGSIFFTDQSANPGTVYGGTWIAWGSGKVPVGVDATQDEFNTVEETGGNKNVTLVEGNLPAHKHSINHDHPSFTSGSDSHSHTTPIRYSANGVTTGSTPTVRDVGALSGGGGSSGNAATSSDTHSHAVDVPAFTGDSGLTGSGTPVSVLQPYITVYMWKRTA